MYEKDEYSLELNFDQSIRMEGFAIEISLPIIISLHFTCDLNSSTSWETLFAYRLGIRTIVYVTSI